MRANGSLDYTLRRLDDAFLNFWFLGSHILLVLRKIRNKKFYGSIVESI